MQLIFLAMPLISISILGIVYKYMYRKRKSLRSGYVNIFDQDFEECSSKTHQEMLRDFTRVLDSGFYWFLRKQKTIKEFHPIQTSRDATDGVDHFCNSISEYMGHKLSEAQTLNIIKWTSVTPCIQALERLREDPSLTDHILCLVTNGKDSLHCLTAGYLDKCRIAIFESPDLLSRSQQYEIKYAIRRRTNQTVKDQVIDFAKLHDATNCDRTKKLD